jgi:hypothetical protein
VRCHGLQTRQPKPAKQKGGAAHLLFPKGSIRALGRVHQSADFVGRKYITRDPNPITIFATSYYAPFKLYQLFPVTAEKSLYARTILTDNIWRHYPLPNVFRIDNGLQFRGGGRGVRTPGRFVIFLLNLGIVPLFSAPSLPYTNPHIEGHNRAFDEMVWRRDTFADRSEVAAACRQFNEESVEFFEFAYREMLKQRSFRSYDSTRPPRTDTLHTTRRRKICFIRFPESLDWNDGASFVILNDVIRIPQQYAHQFVFVEWDLEDEQLSVFSEYQGSVTLIQRTRYRLNL